MKFQLCTKTVKLLIISSYIRVSGNRDSSEYALDHNPERVMLVSVSFEIKVSVFSRSVSYSRCFSGLACSSFPQDFWHIVPCPQI
jgi:hypothetical protein